MSTFHIKNLLFAFFMMLGLTSCEVVGGIFEAGFWTAIIMIVVVVIIIGVIIKKFLS